MVNNLFTDVQGIDWFWVLCCCWCSSFVFVRWLNH